MSLTLGELQFFEKQVTAPEFSRIGSLLPVALCLYSAPKGAIYFLNTKLADWLGHSDPLALRVHPDDVAHLEKNIFEKRNAVFQIRMQHISQQWVCLHVQTSIFTEHEQLIVLQNVTEQKNRDLDSIQTAKLATLGELSGAIAHEINNPLAVIAAKADLLKRKISSQLKVPTESTLQTLQEIYDLTFRISKIMKGLRTMLRKSDHEPFEEITMKSVLADVLLLIGDRFANEGIEFRIDPPPPVTVSARAVQISQIFINLLNNSFDALVAIRPRNLNAWISISFEVTSNGFVRCFISDSGPGVDPKIRDRLMEPFQTTKFSNGTGLGLSISKSIAHEHGGKLAHLASNRNTTFCLELPVAASARKAA